MIVLGIDPGYAIVGCGVVEYDGFNYKPVYYGAVTTEAHTPFNKRLELIYDGVKALIDRYHPDAVSMEKLFFNTNQKTAIDVAQARGVTVLAIQKSGLPIYEYTPLQVKQGIVGYGRAEKFQVQEMVRSTLCLKEIPKPDDAADALAMAICHCNAAGSLIGRLKNESGSAQTLEERIKAAEEKAENKTVYKNSTEAIAERIKEEFKQKNREQS